MQTNTAMLAKAGVRAPTTWTTLRDRGAAADEPRRRPAARPICLSPGWDRMLAFVYQNNGAFLERDKTRR